MTDRWDETWHRLREWTNGQGPSERLSGQILLDDGYQSLDPSHPLGGKDGIKDAVCVKDGQRWIMAAYFPRGQKEFSTIKEKFINDLAGVAENAAIGIVFVTNQELRLAEREELRGLKQAVHVDLFHLERITAVLDQPKMASIRKQFLNIDQSDPGKALEFKTGDGGAAIGGVRGGDSGDIIFKTGDGGDAIGGGRGGDSGGFSFRTGDGREAKG
jgi:hypothetical protein